MWGWIFEPAAPAWIQAVGTVVALAFAVGIPMWQRWRSRKDERIDQERERKEHLKRLTAGLRAEVNAALEAADRQLFSIEHAFAALQKARETGAVAISSAPIRQGSMLVTDAVVYRQVAAELGRFPSALIRSIVQFYSLASEMGRIADGAPTAVESYRAIQPLGPRLKMSAAMLIRTLDKFEAGSFATNANLTVSPEEIRELADKVGFRLDELLKERGLQDPAGVRVER